MKKQTVNISLILLILSSNLTLYGQESTIVSSATGLEQGLSLEAVGELFRDSENLEEFERGLNDPDKGINNLDLDGNGSVDFLRVVEESDGQNRTIILQAILGDNELQDVAYIDITRIEEETYEMQIRGDETVYGPDLYVYPADIHIRSWPLVVHLYHHSHRPYRSPWLWNKYPGWWKRRKTVSRPVYRGIVYKKYHHRVFIKTKKARIARHHRIAHKRRTSALIKEKRIHRKNVKNKAAKQRNVRKKKRR